MPLNEVTMTVQDGNLGLTGPSADRVHVKIGCAASGSLNTVEQYAEPSTVRTRLARGPLARALGFALASTTLGRRVGTTLGVRCATASVGYVGPVRAAPVGAATGTITVAATSAGSIPDRHEAQVEVTATGTLGTGRFRFSLDGGNTWSAESVIPAGGTYAIVEAGVTVTFVPGAGPTFFQDGDLHHFRTVAPAFDATGLAAAFAALRAYLGEFFLVHVVGTLQPALSAVTSVGTSPPVVTVGGTPADHWPFKVKITLGGALATAKFQYSLDGGATYNGADILTAATYAIPETGVTLAFPAGTYNVDNEYTFSSTNTTGITTVYNAVRAEMASGLGVFEYAGAVIEAPAGYGSALVTTKNALTQDPLMSVAAGFVKARNGLDSRVEKRSVAWPAVARLAAIPPGEQAMRRAAGPLALVDDLYEDARTAPELAEAGFIAARTVRGLTGTFLEDTPMCAAPTSDVRGWVERRVLDVMQRVGRAALLAFQGASLRVEAGTGYLDERDAARVDDYVATRVREALREQVSSVAVATVRTDNLVATPTLRVAISAVPLGYAKSIEGLVSLALTTPTTAV